MPISRPTVIAGRALDDASGIGGLRDRARSGRPRAFDHSQIISTTLKPPPPKLGVTHWSSRLLAKHLGISFAAVARAWRDYEVDSRQRGAGCTHKILERLIADCDRRQSLEVRVARRCSTLDDSQ
ncbi:MAG TPA: hypothetical protein VN306_02865 [Mycobacterium sp.]|nr:hypothetical protein [Mycobacterium sp.]